MTKNVQVRLRAYASGVPDARNFEVVSGDIPKPARGEALCRTLYLSLDPYMRVSMLPPASSVPSGSHSRLPLGAVVSGQGVSEVVESTIDGLVPRDLVVSETGWQAYSIATAQHHRKIEDIEPPSAALGVLGMPGFTAWSGLRFVGRPEAGETVVVSAASGAVGSLVVQLAHRSGCHTVGIAGSERKCAWVVEDLGADHCVSHRSSTLQRDLADACPNGVDVYFDNVGGDVLEAVLASLNPHARVPVCGRIAHLNEEESPRAADRLGVFLGTILTRALTVRGFTSGEFAEHWSAFVEEVAPLVRDGTIKYREDIVDGLDQAPTAFARLFNGTNFGKLIVRMDAG